MISVCFRLQNIHSHKPELYQGKRFEAVENMILVHLFQDRIKARFRNPYQIICYYKQEFFLNRIYWIKFLYKIPEDSINTSQYQHRVHQLQGHQKYQNNYFFRAFRSRLDFKRKILQQELHNDGDR